MSTIKSAKQLNRNAVAGIARTTRWRELVEQEIKEVPTRIFKETGGQIRLKCGEQVRDFLLDQIAKEGYQRKSVKKIIERYLCHPLLRIIFTGQIRANEALTVEVRDDGKELYFNRPQVYWSNKKSLL